LLGGLSLEGSTYSDVVKSLRPDLAERYLIDKALSISQIAWLLGYQEISALRMHSSVGPAKHPEKRVLMPRLSATV